jgi:hypothetical protein
MIGALKRQTVGALLLMIYGIFFKDLSVLLKKTR